MKSRHLTGYGLHDTARQIARRAQQERELAEELPAGPEPGEADVIPHPFALPGIFLPPIHDGREAI